MSKLIALLNNPLIAKLIPVVVPVLMFILGIGDVPQLGSVEAFTAFVTSHFPQLGGLTIAIALLYQLVKSAREHISPNALANALADGKLDIGDVIGAVDDGAGPDVGTYVKSALADGAFITLFHACDFDSELTAKLSDTHALYRQRRVNENND